MNEPMSDATEDCQEARTAPALSCEACGAMVGLTAEQPVCDACGAKVSVLDGGVLDLRKDRSFDTLLDVAAYDEGHNVGQATHRLAGSYEGMLRDAGLAQADHVLEIGAGSGNLTEGLLATPFFGALYSSDISPDFMALLQRRVGPQDPNRLRCILLDANDTPFADSSFDCVIGHSILHHLAYFERTLAECYRVTKPNGACAFAEPILDIHVYAAYAAKLILALEEGKGTVPSDRRQVLRALGMRPDTKRANLEGDRDSLAEVEDKFMFPIDYMHNLAREIGFARMRCVSPSDAATLGQSSRTIIERTLAQRGAEPGFLDDYAFVFDELTETIGKGMANNHMAPFSFFVFEK